MPSFDTHRRECSSGELIDRHADAVEEDHQGRRGRRRSSPSPCPPVSMQEDDPAIAAPWNVVSTTVETIRVGARKQPDGSLPSRNCPVAIVIGRFACRRVPRRHHRQRRQSRHPAAPLRTIQRAADLAQPGDTVTVHAGVYRECVNPPRGGESDTKRIVYQAAFGERVVITGSEVVKNWEKVQDGVWKATLPNTFFGSFNPLAELIGGDWFHAKNRSHHAGAVYLNGDWLTEAVSLEEVLKPMAATPRGSPAWTETASSYGCSSRVSIATRSRWRSTRAGPCSAGRSPDALLTVRGSTLATRPRPGHRPPWSRSA